MTNQEIIDDVEDALPSALDQKIKEKILDHVWDILNDELGVEPTECLCDEYGKDLCAIHGKGE